MLLKDSMNFQDDCKITTFKENEAFFKRGPKGTRIIIRDHDTGEVLSDTHNKILITGAQFAACKIFGLDAIVKLPNYNEEFGLENTLGITDYCAGKTTREEIVQSFENLDVISSGSSSPFPSKILESQVLAELIEEAKTKYDYIFIDTPPVLAASDALLISRFVTNYLVIIKHGHTKKNDFDEVVRQFTNNNLEISGVVFDSVASKQKGYYKYNYRYGYGKKIDD